MQFGLLLLSLLLCNLCFVTLAQKECPNAPSSPQDRRSDKSQLKIATYNAEWLFLNRSNCPGSGCVWHNESAALKHMKDVAEELQLLNADIVNLAEVQDCIILKQLNSMLPGMGYLPYLLTGTDTSTGQNMALLTRVDPSVNLQRTSNRVEYPIPGSTCGSTYKGDTGVSKHYYTTFNVAGLSKPLTIFGMHLLAFPDDVIRCVQREGQASVIQQLVAQYISSNSVIVLGDLNDFDPTVLDASGNVPISSVLDILRDPVANQPGDELTNVASFVLQQSQRYSCWYDKDESCSVQHDELSMIDHLLISNDLVPLVTQAYMDHTYQAECGTYESDHWPVIVTLDLSN